MRKVFYTSYIDEDGDVVWVCVHSGQEGLIAKGATPDDAYRNLCDIETQMMRRWPAPHFQ